MFPGPGNLPLTPDVVDDLGPSRCCDHCVFRGGGGGTLTIIQHPEAIASFVSPIYQQQQQPLPSTNISAEALINTSIDTTFGTFSDLGDNTLTTSPLFNELPTFWNDDLNFGDDCLFLPSYLGQPPAVNQQYNFSEGVLYPDPFDPSTIQLSSIWTSPLGNIIAPVSPNPLQLSLPDLFGDPTASSTKDSTPQLSSAVSSSQSRASLEPSPPNHTSPTRQSRAQLGGCPVCGRIVKNMRSVVGIAKEKAMNTSNIMNLGFTCEYMARGTLNAPSQGVHGNLLT